MKRLLLSLFTILILSVSCVSPRGFSPILGIQNFDVVDEHVCRGAQPNQVSLIYLRNNHITAVLNLCDENEIWSQEEIILDKLHVANYSIPLSGIKSPSKESIETILGIIADEAKKGGIIFIHCQHGCDRTGLVVACYQIRYHHVSNKDAQKEADMYGMSKLELGMRNFIKNFK